MCTPYPWERMFVLFGATRAHGQPAVVFVKVKHSSKPSIGGLSQWWTNSVEWSRIFGGG